MRRIIQWLPTATLVLAAGLAQAQAPAAAPDERVPVQRTEQVAGRLKLTIVDLAPRFLDFHAAAQGVDADTRWALWQRKYDFAAVPPTPQGQAMARAMLDEAWPRYAAVLPAIRAGGAAMQPRPLPILQELVDLLGLEGPFEMQVRTYVGAFDANAFTTRTREGVPSVAIPLEMSPAERELMLRHEMAHAVHLATAGLDGGWERSIAQTIVQEGIATRAVEALLPGRPAAAYVEHRPGWYAEALPRTARILEGLAPVLDARDNETVFRYTMGTGSTGTEREAYLAGWIVVGELMREGRTLADIARVPSDGMPALVREA
ncbi:MAG TPA: hypothetical protein VIG68_04295, partial [Lysobacter sp.]